MTMSLIMKIFMMSLILSMMMIIISSTLVTFIHPLMLILLLVLFTVINLIFMFIVTGVSIYMFMIFISIIGGMMIMFLYFTSMINNYPSKIKLNELLMILYMFSSTMLFMLLIYLFNLPEQSEIYFNNKFLLNKIFIYKIYLFPLNLLTISTVLNLLYSLILTIKMCSSKYSPLRKISYEKI